MLQCNTVYYVRLRACARNGGFMEENKSVYALTKISDTDGFREEIAGISGVLSVSVDAEKMTLEYTIDDWTSEYDVFTAVLGIAEAYGVEFNFNEPNETDEQTLNEEQPSKEEPEEEELDDETDSEEDEPEKDGGERENRKKKKKELSETVQRAIELSIAAVCFICGLFFEDTLMLIFLSVAFALAGYEVLYRAIVKIAKKQIINEELILSLAFFACILLGKSAEAVAAMLTYSLASFALKAGTSAVESHSPTYSVPEKCRRMSGENKAVRVAPEEIVVGDNVFFKKDERCLFDGTVKTATVVVAYDGTERTLEEGDAVYAGEKFCKNAVVEVEKTIGCGKYDERNARAVSVARSKGKISKFIEAKACVYLPCFLAFCSVLAFVPPIFCDGYAQGLSRWGYTAAIIAASCSSLLLCGTESLALFAAILPASKRGVMPADCVAAEKLEKADDAYIDRESVMTDENGMKGDCRGAALELKDFGVTPVMVTSLPSGEAVELCAEYKYPAYAAEKDDSSKVDIFDKALKDGKIVVVGEDCLKKYGLTEEKGVLAVYGNESCDYAGSVAVTSGRLADLPFAVKLAARTTKIRKASFIAQLAVKGVLAVLALCGIAELWWAFLADTLVGIGFCIAAVLNKNEVL